MKGEQDMKMKKLILTTSLILALGLGACGAQPTPSTSETPTSSESSSSSSESQVTPVSRIKVEAPAQIVVGEEVDLDQYVTVVGGEGEKVYTVSIPAAQEGKVEVNGHKLVALVEGEISVTIEAGEKTAKFSSNALTELKANFSAMTGGLTTEWAFHEVVFYQDGTSEIIPNTVVHRNDYTYFAGWEQDEAGNELYGGFLQAQNGNCYSYAVSGGEMVVDPTIQSSFGNYFCNMGWGISTSDLEYVEETDPDTGNTYEYLVLSSDVECTQYSSYFDSQLDFFMYTLALSLNDNYYFSQLVIEPTTIEMADGSIYETFAFVAYVNAVADDSLAGVFGPYILETRNEVSEIAVVREYIDAGNAPEGVDATPLVNVLNTIGNATSATLQVTAGWYNSSSSLTGTAIADPLGEEFPDVYHAYFSAGREITKYDATGVQNQMQGSNILGMDTGTGVLVEGIEVVNDTYYSYTNVTTDPSTGGAAIATTFSGRVDTEMTAAGMASLTLAGLASVTAEDIVIYGVQESETQVAYSIDSVKVWQAVTNASYLGGAVQYLLANGWTNDMTQYISTTIIITSSVVLFNFSLGWDAGQYYVLDIMVGNIGSTTIAHPEYTIA